MKHCKAHGTRWCKQCVLFTLSFPLEHFLWERTPLSVVAHLLGV